MPAAEASQWVEDTMPKVPLSSGLVPDDGTGFLCTMSTVTVWGSRKPAHPGRSVHDGGMPSARLTGRSVGPQARGPGSGAFPPKVHAAAGGPGDLSKSLDNSK